MWQKEKQNRTICTLKYSWAPEILCWTVGVALNPHQSDGDEEDEDEDANVALAESSEQHLTVRSRWREQVPDMKLQPENKVFHCISLHYSLSISYKSVFFVFLLDLYVNSVHTMRG